MVTAYGGAELLRETARVVGLDGAVAEHLHLKVRARGLSEAQFRRALDRPRAMPAPIG
jgi:hypothetical protein